MTAAILSYALSHLHEGTGKLRKTCGDTVGPFHRVCPQSAVSEKMTYPSAFRYAGRGPTVTHPSTGPAPSFLTRVTAWCRTLTTHRTLKVTKKLFCWYLRSKKCWANKIFVKRPFSIFSNNNHYNKKITQSVLGIVPTKITQYTIWMLRARELIKLGYRLQWSVSLSRQSLAALYCWDGDLAFYTNRIKVFFTCWSLFTLIISQMIGSTHWLM